MSAHREAAKRAAATALGAAALSFQSEAVIEKARDPEAWGAAKNADHEAQKFQQETLRTSALAQLLQRWYHHAEAEGCRADGWNKACARCELMRDTQALIVVGSGAQQ